MDFKREQLVLLEKVPKGQYDASSMRTSETLVLTAEAMSKLNALAANKTKMAERWKVISPGKKKGSSSKTTVSAAAGSTLVAEAAARANEKARAKDPATQVRAAVARVLQKTQAVLQPHYSLRNRGEGASS